MADFASSLPFILKNEGGKCDIPGDTGGRTNAGVSTPALNDFNSKHPELGFPSDTWELNSDQIAQFYRMAYWKFDGMTSQFCATKIFDMDVNMGLPSGIHLAQEAANACGQNVVVDSHYGPGTEGALNACDPDQLMHMLAEVSMQHYNDIVAKHPEDHKFISGWLHRATLVPTC